jgi:hypothetical protein
VTNRKERPEPRLPAWGYRGGLGRLLALLATTYSRRQFFANAAMAAYQVRCLEPFS